MAILKLSFNGIAITAAKLAINRHSVGLHPNNFAKPHTNQTIYIHQTTNKSSKPVNCNVNKGKLHAMQAADPMDTPVPSYAAGAMPSSFAAPMHDIAVHLAQIYATLKSLTKNV